MLMKVSRTKILILFPLSLGCLVGGLNFAFLSDVYDSKATIMPKASEGRNSLSQLASQISSISGISSALGSQTNSEMQQFLVYLRSDALAAQVLNFPLVLSELVSSDSQKTSSVALFQLRQMLRKRLRTQIEGGVLHLSFEYSKPKVPQLVLQSYLAALQNFLNDRIVNENKNTQLFVQSQLSDLNKNLDETEQKLEELKKGRSQAADGRSLQSEILRAQQDQSRLIKLSELLNEQFELSRIETKRKEPMLVVIDPPSSSTTAVGPHRIRNTLAAILFGMIAGLLLVVRR